MIITLRGPIPSKKSLYRRGKNGGLFLDRAVVKTIDGLIIQAKAAWHRPPIKHPHLSFELLVTSRRQDRDNILLTLMDVLVKAGVLVNDNIASCNGSVVLLPARVGSEEGARIEVYHPQLTMDQQQAKGAAA